MRLWQQQGDARKVKDIMDHVRKANLGWNKFEAMLRRISLSRDDSLNELAWDKILDELAKEHLARLPPNGNPTAFHSGSAQSFYRVTDMRGLTAESWKKALDHARRSHYTRVSDACILVTNLRSRIVLAVSI